MTSLRYIGNPLVDVGVATITAFADVARPEEVRDEDLDRLVTFLTDLYMNPAMARYLGYVVFANIYFANPGLVIS